MNKSIIKTFGIGLAVISMLASCHNNSEKRIDIGELKKDTTVYLVENNTKSPTCRFDLEYKYLSSTDANDSITQDINRKIQHFVSDGRISGCDIQLFPNRLAQEYLKHYNQDVRDLYQADLSNNIAPDRIPAWYNYEFSISTNMESGYHNLWNYEVEEYQFTGGAHPNTFARKMNIDATTGKVLTKGDVFSKGAESAICEIILRYLIEEVNHRIDEDSIVDIEGLREMGLLLDIDLFVPDNFLLKEDGVEFYYNRYEIGPYVVGDFEILVPYNELSKYIILK